MVGVVGGYVVGRLMRELSVVGFSCFGLWLWIVGCQWSSSVVLFSVVGFGRGWVGWVVGCRIREMLVRGVLVVGCLQASLMVGY